MVCEFCNKKDLQLKDKETEVKELSLTASAVTALPLWTGWLEGRFWNVASGKAVFHDVAGWLT